VITVALSFLAACGLVRYQPARGANSEVTP
jgi:hypothetical protein